MPRGGSAGPGDSHVPRASSAGHSARPLLGPQWGEDGDAAAIGTVTAPPASARTGSHCGDTDVFGCDVGACGSGPSLSCTSWAAVLPALSLQSCYPSGGRRTAPLLPGALVWPRALLPGRWLVAVRCVCASRVQSALRGSLRDSAPRSPALEAPLALCQV